MESCAQCGTPLLPGAAFCGSCGAAAPAGESRPGPAPGSAPGPATTAAVRPDEIVLWAGAGVVFVASFLEFYSTSAGLFSLSWSAWSNALSLFPAVPLAALAILAVGALSALRRFVPGFTLPDAIARDYEPLRALVVVTAALVIVAFALRSIDGVQRGLGAWLMLLAAVAAVVGVAIDTTGHAAAPHAGTSPRALSPDGIVTLAGAALALIGSFLDFAGQGPFARSAWSTDFGLPALTLPSLLAVATAVLILVTQLGAVPGERAVLGVTLTRWARALGIESAALMLSFAIGSVGFGGATADRKAGFWVMLLGTLVVAAAVIAGPRLRFSTTSTAPRDPAA